MKFSSLVTVFLTGIFLSITATASDIQWQAKLHADNPLVGKIYDVKGKTFISEAELITASKKVDYFLIGETHDNPDHHTIEQRLLDARLAGNATPSVTFEMLDDTHTANILTLSTADSSEAMNQKLNWGENRWPWETYGPLFQTVITNNATLVAGNISKSVQMQVYTKGEAGLEDAKFNSIASISTEKREILMDEVYSSHCGKMPREKLEPMRTIQMAKDASMAEGMVTSKSADGAVLVAGGYHVRKDVSIPNHLIAKDPGSTTIALIMTQVRGGENNISDYAATQATADYLWFTPMFSDRDYCDDIK